MIEVIFLIVLGVIWIIFATIQDVRNREVANWLNFSLVIFALGFRFFYSLFTEQEFVFFYNGLFGFGIFFVLGNVFYDSKIFAGGDAKLMIALGPVIGFSSSFLTNLEIFALFFVLFLLSGSVYGLVYSLLLMSGNFKRFKKEFLKIFRKNKNKLIFILFMGLVFAALGFTNIFFFYLGILIFAMPYFYVFARAVDESCMVKLLKVKELREGDWLYKDVKVGRKIIKAEWAGLSKNDIQFLIKKRKNKKILIRQGVPFTPAFLIAFLLLIFFWFFKGGFFGVIF